MFYDTDQTQWAAPERLHENATLYLRGRGKGPEERQAMRWRPEMCFATSSSCSPIASRALAAVYAALKSAQESSRAMSLSEIIEPARRQARPQ
jgi:hypothetical protein